METEEIYKTIQGIFQPTETHQFPDISRLLTPFTEISEIEKPRFLYDGTEEIPFNERLPEYQEILINEFLTDFPISIENV